MSKRFSAGGDSPASKKTPSRSHEDVRNRVPQQQHMNVTNSGDSGNIFIPCPIINVSQLSDPFEELSHLSHLDHNRDVQKIGPQLGISPISGHF